MLRGFCKALLPIRGSDLTGRCPKNFYCKNFWDPVRLNRTLFSAQPLWKIALTPTGWVLRCIFLIFVQIGAFSWERETIRRLMHGTRAELSWAEPSRAEPRHDAGFDAFSHVNLGNREQHQDFSRRFPTRKLGNQPQHKAQTPRETATQSSNPPGKKRSRGAHAI